MPSLRSASTGLSIACLTACATALVSSVWAQETESVAIELEAGLEDVTRCFTQAVKDANGQPKAFVQVCGCDLGNPEKPYIQDTTLVYCCAQREKYYIDCIAGRLAQEYPQADLSALPTNPVECEIALLDMKAANDGTRDYFAQYCGPVFPVAPSSASSASDDQIALESQKITCSACQSTIEELLVGTPCWDEMSPDIYACSERTQCPPGAVCMSKDGRCDCHFPPTFSPSSSSSSSSSAAPVPTGRPTLSLELSLREIHPNRPGRAKYWDWNPLQQRWELEFLQTAVRLTPGTTAFATAQPIDWPLELISTGPGCAEAPYANSPSQRGVICRGVFDTRSAAFFPVRMYYNGDTCVDGMITQQAVLYQANQGQEAAITGLPSYVSAILPFVPCPPETMLHSSSSSSSSSSSWSYSYSSSSAYSSSSSSSSRRYVRPWFALGTLFLTRERLQSGVSASSTSSATGSVQTPVCRGRSCLKTPWAALGVLALTRTSVSCGNGIVDIGEQCDHGRNNLSFYDQTAYNRRATDTLVLRTIQAAARALFGDDPRQISHRLLAVNALSKDRVCLQNCQYPACSDGQDNNADTQSDCGDPHCNFVYENRRLCIPSRDSEEGSFTLQKVVTTVQPQLMRTQLSVRSDNAFPAQNVRIEDTVLLERAQASNLTLSVPGTCSSQALAAGQALKVVCIVESMAPEETVTIQYNLNTAGYCRLTGRNRLFDSQLSVGLLNFAYQKITTQCQ